MLTRLNRAGRGKEIEEVCGIAGIVHLNGEQPDPSHVQCMLDRLHHRGPDECGLWIGEGVVLGHTRLSIIDTRSSHQPMHVGDAVLVYNGEVLNYRELRQDLDGPWSTEGDTETIGHLLAQRGTAALPLVRGQFALARWEEGPRRLTLARDAMGVLPLFWWTDGTRLIFASEISALLAGLPRRPSIDRHGLSLYLGYRAVPSPRTLWEGVHKLQPGHSLSTSMNEPPAIQDWRTTPPTPSKNVTFEEAVDQLRSALDESVRLALVSDVSVGAYLSGGLDSSLIAALAQRHMSGSLRTYCATFGDIATDESPWARQVANHLRTTHTDVKVAAKDFLAEWPRLSRLRGAPVSEPADIAVNRLAARASQDVTVVLSGEGSDELFAGYPKYGFAKLTRYVGLLPSAVRGPVLTHLGRRLPKGGRRAVVALDALAQRDEESRIRTWFASFTPSDRLRLLGRTYPEPPLAAPRDLDPLSRMLRHDQGSWLSDNLLERGDRMTMAASVELRPPFLDPAVVCFARSLPPRVLRHRQDPKAVVKGVASDLLPPQILDRPKSGFKVPLADWLRSDMRKTVEEMLLPESFVMSQLAPHIVHQLAERHLSGRADESIKLWTLLSLEIWWQSQQ